MSRRFQSGGADDRREVGHLDNIELVREILAVQLRARRLIFPDDVIIHVSILAVMRQILFQQLQLPNNRAAGGAVNRGVLRPNRDADGFARTKRSCGLSESNDCNEQPGSELDHKIEKYRIKCRGGEKRERRVRAGFQLSAKSLGSPGKVM